jgi:hypothetical protein
VLCVEVCHINFFQMDGFIRYYGSLTPRNNHSFVGADSLSEVLRVATELQKVNCSVLHLSLSPGELKSRVRGTMAVDQGKLESRL